MPLIISRLICCLILVIAASSVCAKPPKPDPNEHDHNIQWYFFMIEGLPDEIKQFVTLYGQAQTPQSPLDKLCWNVGDLKRIAPPYPSIYTDVGFLCDKTTDSIKAVADILVLTANSSTGGQLTQTLTVTATSTSCAAGVHCSQPDNTTNCTKYSCFGSSSCFHYAYPCTIHTCK